MPNDGMDAAERQALINKADAAAYRALRKAHPDEFREFKRNEAAKLGLDWKPRPSKEERERAELERILRDNPDLKAELLASMTQQNDFNDAH